MLKSELLEKLKDIEDDKDINETIQGIEGLIKPLDFNSIGLEDYKKLISENKTIQGYNQSTLDSAISKAVASHDEKFKKDKLPKIIEEELKKKSNDGLTEDQIALKELQKKIETMECEKTKAENVAKYTKVLGEKKLPTELVDYILADDEETINKNIDFFSNLITNSVNSSVKERLNNLDETPPKSDELTQEQLINQQLQQAMGIK
ncbi:DUF4355 domain-containing protein [Clostridium botulinum]|uniref:DUF4355 domain-containing protein n=1 Tax=Clostridium botulinum TaxID=1491 RepID=UPI001413F5C3|nr:DUF4355 domain-containing protein [Clostridium botulinum]MBN1058555.1 DUF4355 domain-containing protein [Clostridium botulinum]NFL57801.1 DUF4355 domain-containing protein [Clostridium botulinum]NFL61050.1 DUF4355 domain-containing protein [Clostridium botulinum]